MYLNVIFLALMTILSWNFANTMCTSNSNQANPGIWRIIPTDRLDAVMLSTKHQFEIEYLGLSNEIKWITSEACHVEDSSTTQTAVSCTKPGFHPITVEIEQSCKNDCNFTKIVKVEEDPFCYQWYLGVDTNSSFNDVSDIQIWIVNIYKAETDELRGSAQEPSLNSRQISELFHLKRQEPKLKIFTERTRDTTEVFTPFFNLNCSCWEITVKMPASHWTYITLAGYSHISQDSCFIRDTDWVITQPLFEDEGEVATLLVSDPSQQPKLIASICSPHLAVVMANGGIVLTQNGFTTVQNITVNIPLETFVVKSVAFSSSSLWMLMIDGEILNVNSAMEIQVYDFGNITGLTVRQTCLNSPLYSVEDNVAVWTNETMFVRRIIQGNENVPQFQQLTLPDASSIGFNHNYKITIVTAKFTFGQDQLLILLNLSNRINTTSTYVLYSFKEASWTYFTIAIQGTFIGSVELEVFASSDISFIFWDSLNVYYSFDMGKSNGMMDLNLQSGSIQQVAISRHDDVLLLADNNDLFYSQTYSNAFIQLSPYQSPDISTSFYMDVLSRLYIITVCDGDVSRQSYSLQTEVESAFYPNIYSFVRYEPSFNPEIVHLDINDEYDLKVNLIHSTAEADSIKVKVSNSHLASLDIQDELTFYPGNREISKTAKIIVNTDFAEVDKKSDVQGVIVIEGRQQKTELKPYRPLRMVTQISVGCPPGRHIQVTKPQSCHQVHSYTIPETARQGPVTNTIVEYDFETFGCPIESNHHQLFRPTLHLYDGEEYVEDVTANFVLWELHKRIDYTFNTTMKQAKCCRTSASWFELDELIASLDSANQLNASCFTEPCDSTDDLSQPYTIMNSSGLSSVKWQNQQDTIFQFTALVVDVYYSFCVLETKFAVKVRYIESVDIGNSVMEMVLGLFTSISLTIAAISYVYFRKAHMSTLNIKRLLPNKDDSSVNIADLSKDAKQTTQVSNA